MVFQEHMGIITVFDLATYAQMEDKPYALLFVHNDQLGWSHHMLNDLYENPVLRSFVEPSGPFQIIHVNAYASDQALRHDILDEEYLTKAGRIKLEGQLRSPHSPSILLLKADGAGKLWLLNTIHYTYPENLAKELSQIWQGPLHGQSSPKGTRD